MTMALDVMDTKIETAELDVEAAIGRLKAARALSGRLEEERRQAQGRLNRGDATAAADIDNLRSEFLAARTAVQDAELGASVAREKVPLLKEQRTKVEAHEVAEHLGPLLEVRAALAELVEAQAAQLAKTASLYRSTVKESVRLAALINVPTGNHANQHVDIIVARRLLISLRGEVGPEFQSLRITPEDPLGKQDPEATAHLRAAVEKILSAEVGKA